MDVRAKKYLSAELTGIPLWLVAVCALAALSMRLELAFNAGHMDEYNYLFVGRWLMFGQEWPSLTYIFGGNHTWWLFALGDAVVNIIGARGISLLLGLLTVFLYFKFVRNLFDDNRIATVATILLSLQAVHIFMSRLATYDVLCVALFTGALLSGYLAIKKNKNWLLQLFVCATLFSGAVLTKYVVLIYAPVFLVLLLFSNWKKAFIFALVTGVYLGVYTFTNYTDLKILLEVQLLGVHQSNTDPYRLLLGFALFLGYPLLFAVLFFVVKPERHGYRITSYRTLGVLILLATPLPAYHLFTLNIIAYHKHLVFSLLFLLPVVALVIVRMIESRSKNWQQQLISGVIMTGFVLICFIQLKNLDNSYPNDLRITQFFKDQDLHDQFMLSENPYFFRYHFATPASLHTIADSGWLDNDGDGTYSHQDVVDALWDRKFDWVYLNDQIHPQNNATYRSVLAQRGYTQVIAIEYTLNSLLAPNHVGTQTLHRKSDIGEKSAAPTLTSGFDMP